MSSSQEFVPFSRPDVGAAEAAAVNDVIRSGWVTSGPNMRAFEAEFAQYMGGDVQAVAVNSATAGLHLVVEALGIGPGHEVVLPTWTFTATAEVVRYQGATPVLADVDYETLNLSLESLSEVLTPRTKAVIPVHFAGLAASMTGIRALVKDKDIAIIEDAAHAIPTRTDSERVGECTGSEAAVFSFYATKTMTTGEGGMLTTRDERIADRARIMRLHGIDRDSFDRYRSDRAQWFYDVIAPGYKYNMPDTAAAMGRVQLQRVEAMHRRRTEIAEHYLREFDDLPILLPARADRRDHHAWHLFVLRLRDDSPVNREEFISKLRERGVGTSVHFIPLHQHSYWRRYADQAQVQLPNATLSAERSVTLPNYSAMTDMQVERVVAAVRNALT